MPSTVNQSERFLNRTSTLQLNYWIVLRRHQGLQEFQGDRIPLEEGRGR